MLFLSWIGTGRRFALHWGVLLFYLYFFILCYFCYHGASQSGGHRHLFAYIGRWLHGARAGGHSSSFLDCHLSGRVSIAFFLLRSTSGGLTIFFRCGAGRGGGGGHCFPKLIHFLISSLLLVFFYLPSSFLFDNSLLELILFFSHFRGWLVGAEGQFFFPTFLVLWVLWDFLSGCIFLLWAFPSVFPRGNAHFSTYLKFSTGFSGVSMYY